MVEVAAWVADARVDRRYLARTYGIMVGREEASSEAYRQFLRGIFRLYSRGPVLARVEAVEWGFAFAAFSVFILLPLHLINNDLESKNVAWFSDLLVACDILFGLQFLASFFYWDEPIEESQLRCMGFIFKSRIQ